MCVRGVRLHELKAIINSKKQKGSTHANIANIDGKYIYTDIHCRSTCNAHARQTIISHPPPHLPVH